MRDAIVNIPRAEILIVITLFAVHKIRLIKFISAEKP